MAVSARAFSISLPVLLALCLLGAAVPEILAQTTTQPPAGASGIASPGVAVFAQNCAGCHGPLGKGTSIAPSLEAASDAAVVADTVRLGRGSMPAFGGRLTGDQISAVADYVAGTIATPLTGGDLSRGGILYRLNCAGCHGATIRGGALVETGGNAPALTDQSAATIAGAIRSGPGPMPIFPPNVMSQQDLASTVIYVQMMQNPDHPGGLPLGYRGPVTEGLVAAGAVGLLALVSFWIERRGRG